MPSPSEVTANYTASCTRPAFQISNLTLRRSGLGCKPIAQSCNRIGFSESMVWARRARHAARALQGTDARANRAVRRPVMDEQWRDRIEPPPKYRRQPAEELVSLHRVAFLMLFASVVASVMPADAAAPDRDAFLSRQTIQCPGCDLSQIAARTLNGLPGERKASRSGAAASAGIDACHNGNKACQTRRGAGSRSFFVSSAAIFWRRFLFDRATAHP